MKNIVFYKNAKGESQISNYLRVLILKNDKDSKLCTTKIQSYLTILSNKGVSIGYPYVKHIVGKIWELRPLDRRILFYENKEEYVMLHIFVKKTQKTPREEIFKAISEMNDYIRRNKK